MFSLAATDPMLPLLIGSSLHPLRGRKELFQLLHHAFCYGVQETLLIVGTNKAILYAVRVKFSIQLLDAFEKIIEAFYEKWFHIFYEPNFKKFPFEKIEEALNKRNENKKKKNVVDVHSFRTNYILWRALNVDVPTSIRFPLPPIAMIIPFINSFWNSTKGPSDTMTKLLDNCEENLGIRSPQCIAVARLLNLEAIAFHRCNQIITGKDPSFYPSIARYRNSANRRLSFQKSIAILIHMMQDELQTLNRNISTIPPAPRTPPPQAPSTRNSSRAQPVTWNMQVKTGCTPGRGRSAHGNNASHMVDQARSETCIGLVPILKKTTLKCRLCSSPTFFVCSWCKRPLCLTAGRGLEKKIDTYATKYNIPLHERPTKFISLSEYNIDGEKSEVTGINTCFHIAHSRQWESFFGGIGSDENNKNLCLQYMDYLKDLKNDKENN